MKHELVARLARRHPVGRVCRVLGVSRSGYYARRRRETPARVREDRRLKQQILAAHTEAEGCYGTPRIERALRTKGIGTSRRRVSRLRRELGLRAKGRRRFRITADSNHAYRPAPDRLTRRFHARRPDQIWVGDITYLAQGRQRWLYLALLMDLYSRRIVGWSLSDRIDEQLTLTALRRAVQSRRPPAGRSWHAGWLRPAVLPERTSRSARKPRTGRRFPRARAGSRECVGARESPPRRGRARTRRSRG